MLATSGKKSNIVFRDPQERKISFSDRIERVIEEEGASFIQTRQGLLLNIDQLVAINGRLVEHLS